MNFKKINAAMAVMLVIGQAGAYADPADLMMNYQTQPAPSQSASPSPQASSAAAPIPASPSIGMDSNPLSSADPGSLTPDASPAPAASPAMTTANPDAAAMYYTSTPAPADKVTPQAENTQQRIAIELLKRDIQNEESDLANLKAQKQAFLMSQQANQTDAMTITTILTRTNNPYMSQMERITLVSDVNTFLGYKASDPTTNPSQDDINMISALLQSKLNVISALQTDLSEKIKLLDFKIKEKQDLITKLKLDLMNLETQLGIPSGPIPGSTPGMTAPAIAPAFGQNINVDREFQSSMSTPAQAQPSSAAPALPGQASNAPAAPPTTPAGTLNPELTPAPATEPEPFVMPGEETVTINWILTEAPADPNGEEEKIENENGINEEENIEKEETENTAAFEAQNAPAEPGVSPEEAKLDKDIASTEKALEKAKAELLKLEQDSMDLETKIMEKTTKIDLIDDLVKRSQKQNLTKMEASALMGEAYDLLGIPRPRSIVVNDANFAELGRALNSFWNLLKSEKKVLERRKKVLDDKIEDKKKKIGQIEDRLMQLRMKKAQLEMERNTPI